MKDCIEIWQKATIKDALPEEYKDKQKAEAVKVAHRNRYGSEQTSEFAPFDEISNILPTILYEWSIWTWHMDLTVDFLIYAQTLIPECFLCSAI